MKKAHNRVMMVGNIYNSWKVLDHSHTDGKIAYYNCECLECNTKHIVDGRNIRNGLSKRCVSCGLKSTSKTQTGVKKSNKSSTEIAENYLLITMRKGASKRKINWDISRSQFVSLIYQNCKYCLRKPFTTVNPTKGHKLQASRATECFITYNGLDRVDSNKNYTIDNVVPCCPQCNRGKLDFSVSDFIAWARLVVAVADENN